MSYGILPPLAIIVLALVACPVLAQRDNDPVGTSFEITGQVRFVGGKKATAEGVMIRLVSSGGSLMDQTTTDSQGRFRFTNMKMGQYTVSVQFPGFKEAKQSVEISSFSRRAQILFDLTPEQPIAAHDPADPARTPAGTIDARVPPEAQKEFEKGQAALLDKKTEKGVAALEKAISLYPDFFEAHLLLGTTYRDAQQWEKAERALRRALILKPQTALALVELGEVHRRQKKFAEAEKVLLEGLKLDDDSWQGHFTLGRVYWERGEPAKAGPPVGRALQLKPDYAEAHLLGANVFMRVGLPQNALVEYEEYLRLAPKGEFAEQTREIVQKLKRALVEKKE